MNSNIVMVIEIKRQQISRLEQEIRELIRSIPSPIKESDHGQYSEVVHG